MTHKFFFRTLTAFLIIAIGQQSLAQDQPYFLKKYPEEINKKRLYYVAGGQSAVYLTSLAILYQAWYRDYPQSNFQFFNDNREWLQMDKIGHATTAQYFGKFGYEMYRWSGMKKKQAIWIGGSAGFVFLTVIEILDGFSAQWGASPGDILANTSGAALFIGQQLGWDEQRLQLKWSYHPTEFADYRPDQLGASFMESMLKDYNGQTYWLSGNIHSFLPESSKFPKWLNVAVGYSGEGMLGANSNPKILENQILPEFTRYRQYYLALDVDLTKIKTNSHFLKFIFNGLNFIKIPAPTLEFSKEKATRFRPIFF